MARKIASQLDPQNQRERWFAKNYRVFSHGPSVHAKLARCSVERRFRRAMKPTVEQTKRLLTQICDSHGKDDAKIMQGAEGERLHALDVLQWVHQFGPRASVPLQIAALFHDIDRVVNPNIGGGFKSDRKSSSYIRHKKRHAHRSAAFVLPLLAPNGYSNDVTRRVEFLIVHHDDPRVEVERFADAELTQLVAADSFAFFTSIAPKLLACEGEGRLRDKIRFMIDKLADLTRTRLREYELNDPLFERLKNEVTDEYRRTHSVRERPFRYCPSCRRLLARRRIDGQSLMSCKVCHFVYWNPPHPVTSVVIETPLGEVLLVQRSTEPLKDYWCLPGGYIRYEETSQNAAEREVLEETGPKCKIDRLVGVYQIDNDPKGVNVAIVWTGVVAGGRLRLNKEECAAARYFSRTNLPLKIAYKHLDASVIRERRLIAMTGHKSIQGVSPRTEEGIPFLR
jgi:8-oxo-dGTP diphosphatase